MVFVGAIGIYIIDCLKLKCGKSIMRYLLLHKGAVKAPEKIELDYGSLSKRISFHEILDPAAMSWPT